MVNPQLTMHLHVDIENKSILIIGKPAAGKTYLSILLAKDNPGHKLIHTDDYIQHGYVESLYILLSDLGKIKSPTIIEGVLGYRLLRKGVQTGVYYPDMVIHVNVPDSLMMRTYAKERPTKDTSALRGFIRSHTTILNEYFAIPNPHPPQWHEIKNNY